MEDLNTVDAVELEEVVTPQEAETTEVVDSVDSDVATDTQSEVDKPKQDRDTNSQFADVRRKAQQEAQDKLIDEMYGSQGIHTKAEYDKAIKEQKEAELLENMRNGDTDPETVKQELYKQWEENDPRLKEYNQIKTESYTNKQMAELNSDLKELGIDPINTIDDLANLPSADKIIEHVKQGKTLGEAYFLANKADIIKQQAQKIQADVIQKTRQLENASPGALDSTLGNENANSIWKMSNDDFAKMKEAALLGHLRK